MAAKRRAIKRSFRLLGHEGKFPDRISPSVLETFPNRSPHRDYWISFECPEFTSLCPVTGQPDFGSITIRYIPDADCIETKSLKYYLVSFRHARSFNEEVINRILEDLVKACNPRRMVIEGEFAPRGGIRVTVEAEHQRKSDIS